MPGGRSALWDPGVRLFGRLTLPGKLALLVLAAMLPWLPLAVEPYGIGPLPRLAPMLLVLPALYLSASAWRARRASPDAPSHLMPAVVASSGTTPAPSTVAASVPTTAGGPSRPAGPPDPPPEAEAPVDAPPTRPGAGAAHADLRASHAEIRTLADELARRTVALAGMLDTCTQVVEQATADLDAIQDEERVAQKVLTSLRARLLALDHRNHALVHVALTGSSGDDDRRVLTHAVQAAEAQVLHCHQLSERLGAAERGVGRHVEMLRRTADALGRHAERGMRESQQLVALTRKVGVVLANAEQTLQRADGSPPRAAG